MHINPDDKEGNSNKTLLVVGGAGGVGTIATQLSKLFGLKTIATASRPETIDWCKAMGADLIINHREELKPQLEAAGISGVDYVVDTNDLGKTIKKVTPFINPLGQIHSINVTEMNVDWLPLFFKRVTIGMELMYAREMFNAEPEKQGEILDRVADLIDQGAIKPIKAKQFPFTLDGLKQAVSLQDSGKSFGKIALTN